MTIKREKSIGTNPRLALLFDAVNAEYSYIENPAGGEVIFEVGGGQSWMNTTTDTSLTGEFLIVPQKSFEAQVKVWGAGGGAHGSTSNAGAGGGGFAKANIQFYKDKPYTIIVGENGHYANHNGDVNMPRHSGRFSGGWPNGGGANHSSGSGGGSSGVFFDASPTLGGPGSHGGFVSSTFHGAGQATAILMAGGGGGMGHQGNSHHGQGGGGGGLNAGVGHAQGASTQNWGGHRWQTGNQGTTGEPYRGAIGGTRNGRTGGGGGGWWGGTGGTHGGTNHHNGGSGGSGHALDQTDDHQPNHWIREQYPNMVLDSFLASSPVSHNYYGATAGGTTDPDYNRSGTHEGYGGGHSNFYTPSTNRGNNGKVLIRFAKEI